MFRNYDEAIKLLGIPSHVETAVAFDRTCLLFSLHPSRSKLAVAAAGKVCILTQRKHAKDTLSSPETWTAPCTVTSICWTAFPRAGSQSDDCCLLVGTTDGFLHLVSAEAEELQSQRVHDSPLLRIRCRTAGMGADPLYFLEDVTVVSENAVMRVSGIELLSVLRGHRVGGWSATDAPDLTVTKWRLPKQVGPRSDAFCAGAKPRGLYDVLSDGAEPRAVSIHSAGSSPALASIDAPEGEPSSTAPPRGPIARALGGGSGASGVASALGSAYRSAAALKGVYDAARSRIAVAAAEGRGEPTPAGGPCRLWRSLDDPKRSATSLMPSPSGGLLVATDNLGRILLLDAPTFTALRIWKGYRDAACGWTDLPPSEGGGGSGALCLVLHAPRKSVVELWEVRSGRRRCAFRCDNGCRLLMPEPPLGGAAGGDPALGSARPPGCCMLEPSGRLVDVGEHARAALGL